MKLLRYLSVITLGLFLFACEEDDKITDELPPEDAVNFTFKPLQINQTVDQNGNTYYASATLVVDADVSSSAPDGYSKQVLIQVVKWEDGEEIEITKGAQFNLSGNGAGDAKSFNLNFDNIVSEQTELNLAANILEAGSLRKIKGQGIFVNVETESEDNTVPYKIKRIEWDTALDKNKDGFFANRSVSFTVATEGAVEKNLTGVIKLINDSNLDTALIVNVPQFSVKREGFSTNDISFSIDQSIIPSRSGYEVLMQFSEVANPGEIAYEQLFKAADFVRIGFEPTVYDDRVYSLPNDPVVSLNNIDTATGYYDSVFVTFSIEANADLEYREFDGIGDDFDLRAPYARIAYFKPYDPTYVSYLNLADSMLTDDPVVAQPFGFLVSDLVPPGDTATYEFKIQIIEPAENFFNSVEDVVVREYSKDDYAILGDVKIDP